MGNGGGASPAMLHYKMGLREPLLGSGSGTYDTSDGSNCNGDSAGSSAPGKKKNYNPTNSGYVPPGYIVLDHRSTAAAATTAAKTSLDDIELNDSISSV